VAAGLLCVGVWGDEEDDVAPADEAEVDGEAVVAAGWCWTRLCGCGLGEAGSFNDTSWPENAAASAASLAGGRLRAACAAGFAAWADAPPLLIAREIANAAPNATATTAAPSAISLATGTA